MNKPDIVRIISEKHMVEKTTANKIITDTFEIILDTIAKGEKVHIAHFGNFSSSERKKQMKYNVSTGEMRQLEATTRPKYRPCKELIRTK